MNVLYLHQYFVDPEGAGGTRSLEFARRLVRDGHHVTMVTSNAMMSEPYRHLTRPSRFEIEGIEVVVIPVAYSNAMSASRRIVAFAQFALRSMLAVVRADRPDVVFATSTPLTIALPAALARVWHRAPVVLEVRDLWPEAPIQMGYLSNGALRGAARLLEKFAYRIATSIVALSPGMAEGVERIVRGRKPVVLVPNAADTDLFGQDEAPRPADGGPDELTLLYSGTLGRANDVGWIIDVLHHLPPDAPVSLLIAGDGAERAAIEETARRRGWLDSRVRFWGPVPKSQMPSLLATADICLSLFAPVPVLETTSPNKLFDALAAGRAVAINYGGWQADLLETHECGLRLDRDPARAAEQICQLAGDRAHVERMGTNARALAEKEFAREGLYQRWSNVLHVAAAARRSRDRS